MCVYAYNVYICKCILYRKSPALFDEVLVEDAELYVCVNTIYMCVNTIYVCVNTIYIPVYIFCISKLRRSLRRCVEDIKMFVRYLCV